MWSVIKWNSVLGTLYFYIITSKLPRFSNLSTNLPHSHNTHYFETRMILLVYLLLDSTWLCSYHLLIENVWQISRCRRRQFIKGQISKENWVNHFKTILNEGLIGDWLQRQYILNHQKPSPMLNTRIIRSPKMR